MKASIDWLAITLLIGLVWRSANGATAVESPGVAGPRDAEAIAQQSPIDIRGDDLQVVKKQAVPALTFHNSTHATVDLENTRSPNEEATVRANVAAAHNTTDERACHSERSAEGAEARNRRRSDRGLGPSTGKTAIPRCARNDNALYRGDYDSSLRSE